MPIASGESGEAWIVYPPYRTDGVVSVSSNYGSVKGPHPRCPARDEWELLTWPELDPIATTSMPPADNGSGLCFLTLTPTAPLGDRWYGLHWLGTDLSPYLQHGAHELRDGSWVFPIHGVTHASVYRIDAIDIEGARFVQAELTEEFFLASGTTWESLFTVSQPGASCSYPGTEVTVGHTTIGFSGIAVDQCTGLDWSQPLHIHLEGAITQAPPNEPVPALDLDWTFGPDFAEWQPTPPEPPACTDPRCL